MPRAPGDWGPETQERCIEMLYGFRDEIIAITRNMVSLQKKQLHLMKMQEQLELDREEEKINEGRYIEDARATHSKWMSYKDKIIDLSNEVPRWESNMHDMLDLCESRGIPCYTPYYSEQTRTLIRLRAQLDANTEKGCT